MKSIKKLTFILTVLVISFTPLDALEISEGSGVTFGRYFFIAMVGSALISHDLLIKRALPVFKILLCFIVWALLTTVWSVDADVTFQRVMLLVQYAIIFSVMVNVLDSPRKLRIAMLGWILGASYIAFKTMTDFRIYGIGEDDLYRVREFGNPNENSFMLCYSILFCYLIDKTKYRLPSICFTIYSVYAFIANGSRMGIILLLLAITGFCIQLWTSKKKWYVIALVPAIIGFGTYILSNIPTPTLMRILGITNDIEVGTLAERETIWAYTAEMLSDNERYCLVGSGWGTFNLEIYRYLGKAIGAHNFYLDLLCTTGIVGLSIVVYYLYMLFRIIRKTYKADILNYLMLVIPMISMLSTNWQSRRWWFMMGAFIYLIYRNRNFTQIRRHGQLSKK